MTNYFSSLSVYAFCKAVENYYTDDKFRIDDYFAAPDGNIDPNQTQNIENNIDRIMASVDDPIIAKEAIETYKEMMNNTNRAMQEIPSIQSTATKPFNAKEEFPELFEDNGDGSVNV